MDNKPEKQPGPETRPRDVTRIVRGNGRNLWTKPPGQRPERLNPPTYEPS